MKKSIRVNNIKKIYGKGENSVKAIDGITLEIESGKFTAIVGESGSGKIHSYIVWQGLISLLKEMYI